MYFFGFLSYSQWVRDIYQSFTHGRLIKLKLKSDPNKYNITSGVVFKVGFETSSWDLANDKLLLGIIVVRLNFRKIDSGCSSAYFEAVIWCFILRRPPYK